MQGARLILNLREITMKDFDPSWTQVLSHLAFLALGLSAMILAPRSTNKRQSVHSTRLYQSSRRVPELNLVNRFKVDSRPPDNSQNYYAYADFYLIDWIFLALILSQEPFSNI